MKNLRLRVQVLRQGDQKLKVNVESVDDLDDGS